MKKQSPLKAAFSLEMMIVWLILAGLTGCERPDPEVTIIASPGALVLPPTPLVTPNSHNHLDTPTPVPPAAIPPTPRRDPLPTYEGLPTPDVPHYDDETSRQPFVEHTVGAGETLGYIAQLYGSSIAELQTTNQLGQSDLVYVGQVLQVPTQGELDGSDFKIIPDSELVYGPAAKKFVVQEFVELFDGYLAGYREEVEGQMLDGAAIVQLVADRHSVNPRLLLAVLEYRSGWVTAPAGSVLDDGYPLGRVVPNGDGLYKQLSWAANGLNWGYYGRSEANITSCLISDGTRIAFDPAINDGTAGVQNFLAAHDAATYGSWLQDVGPNGLFATFNWLFGSPFAYTVDPLLPVTVAQPPMQLPWASGETWYFTGGPHGGWNTGSAWAALDFVPAGEQLGCVQSDAWVTAVADGLVTRSNFGAVVVDLDGDGYAGTGWAVLYMHLEPRDRVAVGTVVQTGDRLGHPSCEGGYSNGTHLHIARLYNGRWLSADGSIPFEMGGWLSQGLGREYDGLLIRGGETKEACECREELNEMTGE